MILTGLVVFLFGTAVSAGPLIPHLKEPAEIVISKDPSADKVVEYYPSAGGSPFISNFIQKGTNVFFKPQFMLSAAQMPPQIQTLIAAVEKDDCKTALPMGHIPMLMEEPLKVVQQEIVASSKPIVKEVIEINPEEYKHGILKPTIELTPAVMPVIEMELPKMPVAVKGTEVVMIPSAPELPAFELPELSVVEEIVPETISIIEIPPAPVLPPLEMPQLPVLVEKNMVSSPPKEIIEVSVPEEPEISVVPSLIPEMFIREVVPSPPEAPVLPPLEFPKPVVIKENLVIKPVEIPTAPILPPFEMPKLSEVVEVNVKPCLTEEKLQEINIKPVEILETPVISQYVPELPEIVVEEKTITIPQPPELPPFSTPQLPISVVIKEEVVLSPPSSEVLEIVEEIKPVIPEAPVMPSYIPVEILQPIIVEEPVSVEVEGETLEPVAIPAAPVLPPFEMPELPVVVEESIVVPCPPNEVHISPPFVPEAPVLPPLPLPELPLHVEVKEEVEPCDTVEVVKPLVIPEAPVLAPYVPIEMPTSVCVEEPVTVEIQKPAFIPSAPILPPLEISKAPIIVEESVVPCPPGNDYEHSKVFIESKPMAMPVPYVLPESSISGTRVSQPIILTSAPEFLVPYFPVMTEKLIKEEPASCVHDIVVERILPNLKKSKAARPPVSAYLAPVRYAMF